MTLQLRYALKYAELGWHVFPVHLPLWGHPQGWLCTCEEWRHSDECKANNPRYFLKFGEHCAQPGKCPRVSWGQKATTDPALIRRWWRGWWANSNVGIACGPSGILTLDADSYKKEYQGRVFDPETLDTVRQITGGGGLHLVYDRGAAMWGNSAVGLPKGVDIRGVGGYIVAAPSIHKSHQAYSWDLGHTPFSCRPAPVPTWLVAILSAHTANGHTEIKRDEGQVQAGCSRADSVFSSLGVRHFGWKDYSEGAKAIFVKCPFNHYSDDPHVEDAAGFAIVQGNGRIVAGCHHARCQKMIEDFGTDGWNFLLNMLSIGGG